MTNVSKKFDFKNIEINVVYNGKRRLLSFEQIDSLINGSFSTCRFFCYDRMGIARIGNSIEVFAQNFTTTYFPNYEKFTFKLIIDCGCARLIDVPSLTVANIFNLTSPTLCK